VNNRAAHHRGWVGRWIVTWFHDLGRALGIAAGDATRAERQGLVLQGFAKSLNQPRYRSAVEAVDLRGWAVAPGARQVLSENRKSNRELTRAGLVPDEGEKPANLFDQILRAAGTSRSALTPAQLAVYASLFEAGTSRVGDGGRHKITPEQAQDIGQRAMQAMLSGMEQRS